MLRSYVLVFSACMAFLCAPALADQETFIPREGDFLFQSLPSSDLVMAIEGASQSPYSHVGLLIKKFDGAWYVREAIGKVVDTPLANWISRGRGAHGFDAFRLKPMYQKNIPAMIKASEAFLDRPYDYQYDMDEQKIYCSELLYKAMLNASGLHLGTLQKLGELNWQPYKATIEKYENGPVPVMRVMITPRALSEAVQLEKVFNGYAR